MQKTRKNSSCCSFSILQVVIRDFYSGDFIDILRSPHANITQPYFAGIPSEERLDVKSLLSDMYNQYINYFDKINTLKLLEEGYQNIEHFRNRFFYATRNNPILNEISDSTQVQYLDTVDF